MLADFAGAAQRAAAERAIRAARNARTASRLAAAARYTQRNWRAKKSYAFNDENVRRGPRGVLGVPFGSCAVCAAPKGLGIPGNP